MKDQDWEFAAKTALGITDEDNARNRALESRVPGVAFALSIAYNEGRHDAEQRMKDFLDDKLPKHVCPSPQ